MRCTSRWDTNCLGGAPAIAIGVISPSNTAQAVEKKTELYFRHGAREVWHVYLDTRRITVHIGATSRTLADNETLTTPLLPGFSVLVSDFLG